MRQASETIILTPAIVSGQEKSLSSFAWVAVGSALLAGFFSLAGQALRTFHHAQLEQAFGGQSGRRRLETLEKHLAPLRLTASFCRSLANIMLVLAMVYLFDAGNDWWLAMAAVSVAAAIIAIFGVAIPHAWARHAGERVLAVTLPALMLFRYLLYPVVAFMQAFDLPVRRLAGAADDALPAEAAKQEILQAASEAQAEGSVEPDEARMIASVMEIGRMQVAQIMTPRTDLMALPASTPWATACRSVVEAGHSRVPVYQDDLDNIIGVLYAKDLLRHVGADPEPRSLTNIMRKAFFVPQTKLLDDLLREFKARQVHVAIVLDEYGGTAGMATMEDILEEIVGEMSDEHDRTEPALMRRIDESAAEVDGRMPVDELNEAMRLSIPEDRDYATVAGLVFSELGYVPKVGETLVAFGGRFTVLGADERKITRLRVEREGE